MVIDKIVQLFVVWPERILGSFQSLLLLGIRLWVGWEFFKAGWLKITNWPSTLFLFRQEYHVPLLPSGLAAVLGTAGELVFPVMLFVGLATRLGALGLTAVNVMAVVSYAHVLLTEGFEAAVGQHYLWGFALLVVMVFGPGKVSIDYAASRAGSMRAPRSRMPMSAHAA
jgi:putative oxidoreductase